MARWRAWLAAVVFTAIVVALLRHRREVGSAVRDIASLSAGWTLALLVLTGAGILASGIATRSVTPGLSVLDGIMVHQATTGANNTVIGSGPVNLGLRVAMLRSRGIGPSTIALTVILLNVLAAYTTWLIAFLVAILGLSGSARGVIDHRVFVAGAALAATLLLGSTLWWWVVLRFPALSRRLAHLAQPVARRLHRRRPRLPVVDLPSMTETLRMQARRLIRRRGMAIVMATSVQQVLVILTPVAVVRAVGIDTSLLSPTEIVLAFGFVRLVAALTPIPGGIGITEIGLVTVLIGLGGPEPEVLTAVLLYRSLTFLLPIVIGGLCLAAWRLGRVRAPTGSPSHDSASGTESSGSRTAATNTDSRSRIDTTPTSSSSSTIAT